MYTKQLILLFTLLFAAACAHREVPPEEAGTTTANGGGQREASLPRDEPGLHLTEFQEFPEFGAVDRGNTRHLTEAYSWIEGGATHTVWLDPRELAEFAPDEASIARVQAGFPGARPSALHGAAMRRWDLPEGIDVPARLDGLQAAGDPTRLSPIFRLAPYASGPRRALPGGVLVRFTDDLDPEEVRSRLSLGGFEVERILDLGSPHYLVRSEPGLACLEAARALAARLDVLSASPNWWFEVSSR